MELSQSDQDFLMSLSLESADRKALHELIDRLPKNGRFLLLGLDAGENVAMAEFNSPSRAEVNYMIDGAKQLLWQPRTQE